MLNPKTHQRELAYITMVTDTKALDGYDRVHYVHVLGWWCVASKDIQVGDRVIYFEVDSVLPERQTVPFHGPTEVSSQDSEDVQGYFSGVGVACERVPRSCPV